MAKPTTFPQWATTLQLSGVSGQNNRVEPGAGVKDLGWDFNEKPPRQFDNWLHWLSNEWLEYFDTLLDQDVTSGANVTFGQITATGLGVSGNISAGGAIQGDVLTAIDNMTAANDITTFSGNLIASVGNVNAVDANLSGNLNAVEAVLSGSVTAAVAAQADFLIALNNITSVNNITTSTGSLIATVGDVSAVNAILSGDVSAVNANLSGNMTADDIITGKFNGSTTDITGLELETLSDGSAANLLHRHTDVFGEIYRATGASVIMNFSVVGEFFQVTAFNTNGLSSGATPDHSNDHITILTSGTYKINVFVTLATVGAGDSILVEIRTNNGANIALNLRMQKKFASANLDTIAMSGFISLNASDTIELWAANLAATNDAIISNISLSIEKIIT